MAPDFADIRARCHGMMREAVYRRVYETACSAPGVTFAETGTGHGAATVCLAMAIKERGGKVYTFDRFEGGGRIAYSGGAAENLAIARQAIAHFGVSDVVEVVPGNLTAARSVGPLGLLMLDADGRIDRDFGTFFDALEVGGALIIDDMADRVRAKRMPSGSIRVDQKHRLTYLLVKSAEEHGLIEQTGMEYQTWFGRKLNASFADWPASAILDAYRSLVFADAE